MKLYAYKKCSSCRDAEKHLIAQGLSYEFVDITLNPPSEEELAKLWKSSGIELKKFFNTSGEVYRALRLKDKIAGMNEKECLKLLASDGKLIKRPLITDGKKTTVGASAEVLKTWK